MNGEPDGGPIVPAFRSPTACRRSMRATPSCIALYHRDVHGGSGQVIDLSLFESLFSLLGPLPAEYAAARQPAPPQRQPVAQRRSARLLSHRRRRLDCGQRLDAEDGGALPAQLRARAPARRSAVCHQRRARRRTRASWTTRSRAPIASRTLAENVAIIEANHLTADAGADDRRDRSASALAGARADARRAQRVRRRPHAQRRAAAVGDARRDPAGPAASSARTITPSTAGSGLSCDDQQRLRGLRRHLSELADQALVMTRSRGRGCSSAASGRPGTGTPLDVLDKYTGAVIGTVECAGRDQVDAAVAAARRSFQHAPLDPQERYVRLQATARLIEQHRDELAGADHRRGRPADRPTRRPKSARAVQTCIVSAEEGKRLVGEMVPIESAPGQSHRMAFTIRVPRGVVCGITAFNSPLNMICHKVAPALASGNTVVMKPSELAPLTRDPVLRAAARGRVSARPPQSRARPGRASSARGWSRTRTSTSTPSPAARGSAAWLRERVGLRPVALELGSISPTIVCEDADLDRAAARCAASAFRRAGQVCTSTQRLFVQRGIEAAFTRAADARPRPRCRSAIRATRATDVGPMISEREAIRAESWVARSGRRRRDAGARRPARRRGAASDHPGQRRSGACASCARRSSRRCVSIVPFDVARRGDRAGQRHAVRAGRRHLHEGHHPRHDRGAPPPRRPACTSTRRRAAASI